jgi:membrane associated rhomboid family serine protease
MAFAKQEDRGLRRPLLICLGVLLAISLVPGVSLAGHLGGLVGGTLSGLAMLRARASY